MNVARAATLLDRVTSQELRSTQVADRLEKVMSKPGKLKLPALLEERRLAFGIPDGAFKRQAAYDRILVYQIREWVTGWDDAAGETFGSTKGASKLFMPDSVKSREINSTPRGIIVSAGLEALDVMRSHAMDLGHIVNFAQYTVARQIVDRVDGHDFPCLIMSVGDISTSEDTAKAMRQGLVRIVHENGKHKYVVGKGKNARKVPPVQPWQSDDF